VTDAGGVPFPHWDTHSDLALMDRHGIAAAVLSVSAPGVFFDDIGLARRLSRQCNEALAQAVRAHPARFGALAVLPLPDVEAALSELAFALDDLRLDGVCLLTNVGGRYLGDPLFDPLMAELDRRHATVFVHPHEPPVGPKARLRLLPALVEYLFDTTRAAANLMLSGRLERYVNVSFILSHGGGAVPSQAWRLAIGLEAKEMPLRDKVVHAGERVTHRYDRDVLDEGKRGLELLRTRFSYDVALSATPFALAALQALVGPDRILFGSDVPFAPEFIVAETIRGLATHGRFDEAGHRAVARDNALRLFPGLAARVTC
jgi:predicted TIM-barrel fold metal-dependent hydrolase